MSDTPETNAQAFDAFDSIVLPLTNHPKTPKK